MKIVFLSLFILGGLLAGSNIADVPSYSSRSDIEITPDTKLNDVLVLLGDVSPSHLASFDENQIQQGEEIVKNGRTKGPNGKTSTYVSKHYVCTTCHNLEQEDPDLRVSDPEARLPYVKAKGIPFLQGTTFKGIVNRETWYNDDYIKKYGDEKIAKAHNSLRESIQLCAIECSQGRPMEEWEIEAVLAYYWTIQFDLGDLAMTSDDLKKIEVALNNGTTNEETIKWIKSFYLQKSPAHFYDAPESKVDGYKEYTGNADNGKDLYELSCLHCHKDGGVSHYELDNQKLSFLDMNRTMFRNSHFSLYQIIPYGTYAIPGHKPYMPHYPLERMNKQQVEDLRAYIQYRVNL